MDQIRILLVLLYFSFFLGRKKELVMVMVMRNTDTQFSLTKRQQFLRYSIICRTYSKGFLFFSTRLLFIFGFGGGRRRWMVMDIWRRKNKQMKNSKTCFTYYIDVVNNKHLFSQSQDKVKPPRINCCDIRFLRMFGTK